MKKNYPVLSQELNDILLSAYENLVYLLGVETESYGHFSGLYEEVATSGNSLSVSPSGIPSVYMSKVIDMLKFDYIYRKHFGEIKYEE